MDQGYRSFSSMNIQSSREYTQPVRPLITSEFLENSSIISVLQLILNMEPFLKKFNEISPIGSKFCGKLKKLLPSFKSDNFNGVSSIVPASLRTSEQKPGFLLHNLLEDFHSCSDIPIEKRPDSLFYWASGDFTIKVLVSKLFDSKLPEILDGSLSAIRSPPAIIAIDLIWDLSPSCEKILNVLMNLTAWRNYDICGVITGHGIVYSSFSKQFDQWRSFSDGKLNSWVNFVWSLVTEGKYPVMLLMTQNTIKGSTQVLLKNDYESMLKFAKLQDQRIKIVFQEDPPKETRIYPRQYIDEKKPYREEPRMTEKKADFKYPQEELGQRELRKSMEDINLTREKKYLPRDYYEEKRTAKADPIYSDFPKDDNRQFIGDRSYRDRIYADKGKDELVKEDPTDFRRSIQDFRSSREFHTGSQISGENPRLRNYSTEPEVALKYSGTVSSRPYQEDLIYSSSRSTSIDPKNITPRPGILKNSSMENSKLSRYSSVFSNQNVTPMLSPRETIGSLSRTFRENTHPDEEITDKPKGSWGEYNPRISRFESAEKKVNFSDSVFRIEDSNKDQMPEIKLTSVKVPEKKYVQEEKKYGQEEKKYGQEEKKYLHEEKERHLGDYKSASVKTTNYLSPDYRPAVKSEEKVLENSSSWSCPKCSATISNSLYECNNCRFINWDKFYALKSRTPKQRAESIPAKRTEKEDSHRYRPLVDSRTPVFEAKNSPIKEAWKPRNEIKVQENYISEEYARRTNRDFLYNR